MKTHVIRLLPGQLLKEEILQYAAVHNILAGFILTCCGSLHMATLRLANGKDAKLFIGPWEIVSLVGTLSVAGGHFHICLADEKGQTVGGHVLDGCTVRTTAEIVLGEAEGYIFSRKFDSQTGYHELCIEHTLPHT